ncbi:MAG: hypothetical protein JWQ57_3242 [Mucilaginibacter sp.]|nr:hypothetical protein [Mucilaginibacter sp.]
MVGIVGYDLYRLIFAINGYYIEYLCISFCIFCLIGFKFILRWRLIEKKCQN